MRRAACGNDDFLSTNPKRARTHPPPRAVLLRLLLDDALHEHAVVDLVVEYSATVFAGRHIRNVSCPSSITHLAALPDGVVFAAGSRIYTWDARSTTVNELATLAPLAGKSSCSFIDTNLTHLVPFAYSGRAYVVCVTKDTGVHIIRVDGEDRLYCLINSGEIGNPTGKLDGSAVENVVLTEAGRLMVRTDTSIYIWLMANLLVVTSHLKITTNCAALPLRPEAAHIVGKITLDGHQAWWYHTLRLSPHAKLADDWSLAVIAIAMQPGLSHIARTPRDSLFILSDAESWYRCDARCKTITQMKPLCDLNRAVVTHDGQVFELAGWPSSACVHAGARANHCSASVTSEGEVILANERSTFVVWSFEEGARRLTFDTYNVRTQVENCPSLVATRPDATIVTASGDQLVLWA